MSLQPAWQKVQPCADAQDPCACTGKVNCTADHTGSHISSLVFASQPYFGNFSFPTSLKSLSYLHMLDFSGDMIGGKLPELPFAQYVWVRTARVGASSAATRSPAPCPRVLLCAPTCGALPTPPPSPAFPSCTGTSASLIHNDCQAWQRFSRDPLYTQWAEGKCGAEVHTDPCSCTFNGKTGCANGRITHIDIGYQGLPKDGVPPTLLALMRLTGIGMRSINLAGTIPLSIVQLKLLTWLDLVGNQFTGTVPAFNLAHLNPSVCDLSGNDFKCPLSAGMVGTCHASCR